MTTTSPLAAAEPKLRTTRTPKLKPFPVRRHDMWGPSQPRPRHTADHEVSLYQPIDPVDVVPAWLHTLIRGLGWPFRALAAAWRRQGEVRDLRSLDEHLLRDMGLTRHDIYTAARKRPDPLSGRLID